MDTDHRSPIHRFSFHRMLIVLSAVAVAASGLAGPASAEAGPVNKCRSGSGYC